MTDESNHDDRTGARLAAAYHRVLDRARGFMESEAKPSLQQSVERAVVGRREAGAGVVGVVRFVGHGGLRDMRHAGLYRSGTGWAPAVAHTPPGQYHRVLCAHPNEVSDGTRLRPACR
jgi:hypothetical protein